MHRAAVAGATGGVGRRVVRALAHDSRVSNVTALVRPSAREHDVQALFGIESASAAAKIHFVAVNYERLAADGVGAEELEVWSFAFMQHVGARN